MEIGHKSTTPLPRSAIVGLVRFKADHKLKRGEKAQDPWAIGPRCCEIERAVPLNPPILDVKGTLGL